MGQQSGALLRILAPLQPEKAVAAREANDIRETGKNYINYVIDRKSFCFSQLIVVS